MRSPGVACHSNHFSELPFVPDFELKIDSNPPIEPQASRGTRRIRPSSKPKSENEK
jgi:hypothetical protein